MAIITVPKYNVPAMWQMATGGSSLGSITLNASGDRLAMIIQCPKAGTLDKFECRSAAVANNPDNGIRLSFQDVSLTTGDPDGSQDQYRDITGTISANTWQVPGLMTSDGTDGGVKRTVAAGELVACVIDFVNFVASDSVSFSHFVTAANQVYRNWYVDNASTGSYVKEVLSGAFPLLALKYSDGTYAEFDVPAWPIVTIAQDSVNTGTTPDELALRFQVQAPQRLAGFWVKMDGDAAVDMVLYDAGGSVLSTHSFDSDQRNAGNTHFYVGYFASGPFTLTPNTTYRLALKPTSGSTVTYWSIDLPGNTYQQCIPGGVQWYESTRSDAGGWSDNTSTRPLIGLIFDGMDNGAGGGGGDTTPYAVVTNLIGPGGLLRA